MLNDDLEGGGGGEDVEDVEVVEEAAFEGLLVWRVAMMEAAADVVVVEEVRRRPPPPKEDCISGGTERLRTFGLEENRERKKN